MIYAELIRNRLSLHLALRPETLVKARLLLARVLFLVGSLAVSTLAVTAQTKFEQDFGTASADDKTQLAKMFSTGYVVGMGLAPLSAIVLGAKALNQYREEDKKWGKTALASVGMMGLMGVLRGIRYIAKGNEGTFLGFGG